MLFLLSALHEVNAQCPTSSGCTFEPLNPVKCGLNFGCFYDNQCLANSAGFTPEDCCDAPIVAAGVCNTILDEHICGSQACPYDNQCIASQAGYTAAQCIPAPLWSDEFRGSTLNENTWTYDLGGGGWGNMELQTYTQQAVQVTGGNLEITANGNYDMGWTSGRIKTQDNLMFQYGRMEARINVPDVADGLWYVASFVRRSLDEKITNSLLPDLFSFCDFSECTGLRFGRWAKMLHLWAGQQQVSLI